ncbi:MAG: hypothetical protein IJR40_00365 [Treponema sp.]|nr:hypothetical protein [Treponema sp.]
MRKIILSILLAAFFASLSSAYTGADVNGKIDSFANEINLTVAAAATQQNVYSQAWIGKLFPSAPPHFAVGIEAGATRFNLKPLKDAVEIFGMNGAPSDLVYPTITANARIGGFVLPFDIGFSAMYLDLSDMSSLADGFGLNFFDIGGDFRYAILKGEGLLPQVSVGFGYYYIGGKVSFKRDGLAANLDYSSHTMFLQAQISKTIIFFTPYLGFRGIFSNATTNWSWAASASKAASSPMYGDAVLGGAGKSSFGFFDKAMPQVYGGFGMNFSFFALNLGAAYEFTNKIWGADISLRFQM